jgi:hypothetical protein
MKIDRREFLKAAAMMGMFTPISEAYGSVSERHAQCGSDARTPMEFNEYRTRFKRGDWKTTRVTRTRVSTEEIARGQGAFRYEAHAQAVIGDELFEEKHLEGAIPRIWV